MKCRILAQIFLFLVVSVPSIATTKDDSANKTAQQNATDDDFDNAVRFPQVGPKLRNYVKSYMQEIGSNFLRDKYAVESMRQGEVIIITIPTDDLFYPNESLLLPWAAEKLDRFKKILEKPNKLKLLIKVHTDNTGSEEYSADLSEQRINAMLDYLENQGASVENVIGYPMGLTEPLHIYQDNANRLQRAKNRRAEFYIVPGEALLQEARIKK